MRHAVNCAETSGACVGTAEAPTYGRAPRVDILETPEEFRVETELPGVRAEEVEVDLENGILRIQAKSAAREANGATRRLREFGVGSFLRTLRLGDSIDSSRITAESKHGVVTVHLPKVGAVKPRTIPVVSTH